VIISYHPDCSRVGAKTPPLVLTIILYLNWESFNEVLSEFFSTIIFKGHAACSLAINIASVSVLLN